MRESMIKDHDGYLGMHHRTLNAGDIQIFIFVPTDDRPFWMTEAEREVNRHDRILPSPPGASLMQNKAISELKAELGPIGILRDRDNYQLTELQELAKNNNIETKMVRSREKKGQEGRPKGLLQVLWERGWIDEAQLDKYKIDVAPDGKQHLEGAEDWSLKCLMASCLDFANEMTALQRWQSTQHLSHHHATITCRIGWGGS